MGNLYYISSIFYKYYIISKFLSILYFSIIHLLHLPLKKNDIKQLEAGLMIKFAKILIQLFNDIFQFLYAFVSFMVYIVITNIWRMTFCEFYFKLFISLSLLHIILHGCLLNNNSL